MEKHALEGWAPSTQRWIDMHLQGIAGLILLTEALTPLVIQSSSDHVRYWTLPLTVAYKQVHVW